MSSPHMEEDGILREWASLSKLLQQIPLRLRSGLFLEDIKFTCIDADNECIAIGTNVGIVFWYDRRTHIVQQLKPEYNKGSITCVKVVTSVEYMVAAGDNGGVVTIFRLPKQLPDWVQPKKPEHIERYTVDELHKSRVTSLTWSINGQKLFSGDALGSVVYTEIDYCMSLSRTCEILNEKYKIYQLCYNQHEQSLIVATELRCIICHYNKPNWRIVQIGQKERHNLLELGGCFFTDEDGKVGVYSCRGGLRLWKADLEGNVKNTIMFKNVINPEKETVRLLRPFPKQRKPITKHCFEFGKLNYWKDGLFVSSREECLIVIDPVRVSVTCCLVNVPVPVTEVALTNEEMFLIMGERDLIRLAYAPDAYDSSVGGFGNMASAEPVTGLPKFDLNPVVGSILIPHLIPPSRIKLSAATANNELSAGEVTYGTDSSSLLPPVVALRDGVPELRLDSSRNHQFSAIGQQEFDEIIFTKSKNRKHKKKRRNSADESNTGNNCSNSNTDIRNSWCSFQSAKHKENSLNGEQENEIDYDLPKDIQPDMRALDAIVKDLKEKELLLDATLVFPSPKDETETLDNTDSLNDNSSFYSQSNNEKSYNCNDIDEKLHDHCNGHDEKQDDRCNGVDEPTNDNCIGIDENSCDDNATETKEISAVSEITTDECKDLCQGDVSQEIDNITFEEKTSHCNLNDSEVLSENFDTDPIENNKTNFVKKVIDIAELSQDSLSSQEMLPSFDIISLGSSSGVSVDENTVNDRTLTYVVEDSKESMNNYNQQDGSVEHQTDSRSTSSYDADVVQSSEMSIHPFQFKTLQDGWCEISCPEKVVSLANDNAVLNYDTLIICSPGLSTYAFSNEKWTRLPYKANCICISPHRDETTGHASAVRLHCSIAYYTNDWRSNETWKIIGRNVDWISMAEDKIWFVSNGELFLLSSGNDTVEKISCPARQLSKVYATKSSLFAITDDHKVLSYNGVDWKRVKVPRNGAKYLALGPKRLFWLVDQNNCLYVTPFPLTSKLLWWQVFYGENCLNDVASICASRDVIYVSSSLKPSIYYNFTSVIGHRWETCNIDIECVQICAEGVFEDKGCIWILGKGNKLYSVSPSLKEIQTVSSPCHIICLASSSQALWVLSDEGEIFVRQGITSSNNAGKSWRKLSLEQFERKVQLSHLSCGCDVVWACDIRGKILMVVGSPYDIAGYTFPPAWVYAEGKPIQNNTFNKVYVGPQSHMVWALDSAGNVYAREAIFPDYLLGTGWVLVPGINALQLSISTESVRALCREGVYKRTGITQSNYIGDAWLLMPIKLDYISATVNEGLWGISSRCGKLMHHSEKVFPISDQVFVETDWTLL